MNINIKSIKNNIAWFFLYIIIGVFSCFVLENKINRYMFGAIVVTLSVVALLLMNKFNFEKSLIILFIVIFPFMTELNLRGSEDFHIMSKVFYRLNYLHLFCIYFLVKIIQNINKIHLDLDIVILLLFNLICILGTINAINLNAFFYEYLKYICMFIVYVYFSRIFEFKKYMNIIYEGLVYGVGIQFVIGILQILKGKRLGLTILGEGFDIFRVDVRGYEKGFSGTFGHPGPFALYANILLIIFLFNKNMKKSTRVIGIMISTLITIIAAGRTSIVLMVIIYGIYFINDILVLNIKSIFTLFVIITSVLLAGIYFYNTFSPIISRFLDSDVEKQVGNRMEHMILAGPYIEENPIIGLGLNNYMDNTKKDYPFSFNYNFYLRNPIHNVFVLYIVEIGYLGCIMFILFLLNNFRMYLKIKNKVNYNQRNVLKGSLLIITVWSIYGLQGWAGVQTRTLLSLFLSASLIYKIYSSIKHTN